jgi:hypothetical protein
MKLSEDGPNCGPKHVAVIKQNQSKHIVLFVSVVLEARIPQIMAHNRKEAL